MRDVVVRGYLVTLPLHLIMQNPQYDPATIRLTHDGVFHGDVPGGKAVCVFSDEAAATDFLERSGLVPAGGEVVEIVEPAGAAGILEAFRPTFTHVVFDVRNDGMSPDPVPLDEVIAAIRAGLG